MNRATQLARGAATASVALFLAAFSHGVAGGEAPGSVGLVLAAIVALATSVAFVGRRNSPVRTALAVVASQGAFHLLFGVGAGPSSGQFVANGAGHHATMAFVETAGTGSTVAHAGHDGAMLVGHALAAVATIVYLLAVERTAWSALASATRRFVLVLTGRAGEPVAVAAPYRLDRSAVAPPVLRSRLRFAALRYRGPPLLPAFA
ncbi:hypothetical protein MUN74_11195 [Agromyces endophyticus]|uniref:hypothetical protein n=1 Tax=Agromyces sp. H17E-10 TaxID=2932244 RepID=UPI001FD34AD8|nr:hypothetical protein [Agromyces sp. H17E-10]UOQ87866.1 hypothetical protein MUN74_11195 [Agromyces sp. H17E-10]